MKKGIAFFDFDGTITTKDTLLEFIKYCKGTNAFYAGFLINSPFLLAYKLKIISNQAAKEKVLQHFFKNTSVDSFRVLCEKFAAEKIPGLIRPEAIAEIKKLQEEGQTVVIVSASPENWISPWALKLKVDLIATQLEIQNGLLTGKILGKNCHGAEKVNRINKKYSLADYAEITAYGDTKGDLPMLALAHRSVYKPFR
ncbi:MAG: HAD family hydrolase [Chitinophagales bacterium]|nr:HAD family hydrolase [Chitinophagales bacterium]